MRPRPPFASELTIERELAEFERLKAHMPEVWASISPDHPEPHTSVIVPSMTLDAAELTKLAGASFYEERLLFLLIRLRNPLARVVFVTSQPVHPLTLEYYFQLLVGVPASHARARLTLLSANDASPRSLTQKILERPRLLERIRAGIADRDRAYLTVFSSTPLERRLAVLLGIPLNGVDPELSHLGSKSGSRKVFRRAGVDLPYGHEDLSTQEDVVDALLDVKAARPAARRAVVKLNESFSGEGNAVFTFPETPARATVETALDDLAYTTASETREGYFAKFRQMGGIVEEFLDGDEKASPSAQLRSDPFGDVHAISTHDQVLGGESGQVFLGCLFPAADGYRREVQEAAHRVGAVLASEGVVSRFGVDFLVTRAQGEEDWKVFALEINLRMGGTTHPFLALQFLTGGRLDPTTGLFASMRGIPKFYRATDNLKSDLYRGLGPEDLIEIVTAHGIHFSFGTESGVLFHLIGALSEFGKLGLTAIGNTRAEAEALYERAIAILDREAAYGR